MTTQMIAVQVAVTRNIQSIEWVGEGADRHEVTITRQIEELITQWIEVEVPEPLTPEQEAELRELVENNLSLDGGELVFDERAFLAEVQASPELQGLTITPDAVARLDAGLESIDRITAFDAGDTYEATAAYFEGQTYAPEGTGRSILLEAEEAAGGELNAGETYNCVEAALEAQSRIPGSTIVVFDTPNGPHAVLALPGEGGGYFDPSAAMTGGEAFFDEPPSDWVKIGEVSEEVRRQVFALASDGELTAAELDSLDLPRDVRAAVETLANQQGTVGFAVPAGEVGTRVGNDTVYDLDHDGTVDAVDIGSDGRIEVVDPDQWATVVPRGTIIRGVQMDGWLMADEAADTSAVSSTAPWIYRHILTDQENYPAYIHDFEPDSTAYETGGGNILDRVAGAFIDTIFDMTTDLIGGDVGVLWNHYTGGPPQSELSLTIQTGTPLRAPYARIIAENPPLADDIRGLFNGYNGERGWVFEAIDEQLPDASGYPAGATITFTIAPGEGVGGSESGGWRLYAVERSDFPEGHEGDVAYNNYFYALRSFQHSITATVTATSNGDGTWSLTIDAQSNFYKRYEFNPDQDLLPAFGTESGISGPYDIYGVVDLEPIVIESYTEGQSTAGLGDGIVFPAPENRDFLQEAWDELVSGAGDWEVWPYENTGSTGP
jgi:hypothetical protein